jgi:transposase
MGKLDVEARMTIKHLKSRGLSQSAIARLLGVTEGAVRYHAQRQCDDAIDGRSRQVHLASRWAVPITNWLGALHEDAPINLGALHDYLLEEHDYPGSLRSVERYFRSHFPKPKKRARRRVETPPGAQAQVDWSEHRGVRIAGHQEDLYRFHMRLSWSRHGARVWSPRKDQLSWHHVHNEAFRRIGGVVATVRVDNEKTAVSRGAGAWGEINPAYRQYARAVRFHVDACPPRSAWYKGKVERAVRESRASSDPRHRHWDSLEELQAWEDAEVAKSARRRICPATGTSVWETFQEEQRFLGVLPILPEPFDLVATRRVQPDCLVHFESRSYSVPFAYLGERVEARGCAGVVQILAEGHVVATHPRHTRERIVIDPRHFEGEETEDVIPPPPLGRMGQRLQEIMSMVPEQRPLDLYAALAEVAR